MKQLCVTLYPWSHRLLWLFLSRAGSFADTSYRTGEGTGRGAATRWGCCFLHCFSTYWCTLCTVSKWATQCERQKLGLAGAVWEPGCISQESGFKAHVWNHLLFFLYVSTMAVISDTLAVVISIARAFSFHLLFSTCRGNSLCLRSAYCLENMLLRRCLFKASSVRNQVNGPCSFVHGFGAAGIGWCFFVWRPAKARSCFPFWGVALTAGCHLSCPHSCPHSAQGGTPRSDPSQHDSACRLLERFAHHPAAPDLLLSLSVPSFPLLFKKIRVSLQVYQSSLRAFFLLFSSINPSSVLFS